MAQNATRLFPSSVTWGTLKNVSDLRDPDRDPDHLLAPERLIELETAAEPARQRLSELPAPALELVQAWLAAELSVARERALEVADSNSPSACVRWSSACAFRAVSCVM